MAKSNSQDRRPKRNPPKFKRDDQILWRVNCLSVRLYNNEFTEKNLDELLSLSDNLYAKELLKQQAVVSRLKLLDSKKKTLILERQSQILEKELEATNGESLDIPKVFPKQAGRQPEKKFEKDRQYMADKKK
jgi:hypothetical protein